MRSPVQATAFLLWDGNCAARLLDFSASRSRRLGGDHRRCEAARQGGLLLGVREVVLIRGLLLLIGLIILAGLVAVIWSAGETATARATPAKARGAARLRSEKASGR
jgi:hypothetical protein